MRDEPVTREMLRARILYLLEGAEQIQRQVDELSWREGVPEGKMRKGFRVVDGGKP